VSRVAAVAAADARLHGLCDSSPKQGEVLFDLPVWLNGRAEGSVSGVARLVDGRDHVAASSPTPRASPSTSSRASLG